MNRNITIVAAMCASLVALQTARADPYTYLVTDLGTLSGPISSATSLDDTGRVAGLSMVSSGNFHAALWDGTALDLGTLGSDTQSMAFAVNSAGQVVGVSYNYGDLQAHAFRWQSGAMSSLGDFSPRDINLAGVIVGHRTFYNSANLWVDQACQWADGALVGLGTLGGDSSDALAINASGAIVGQSHLPGNQTWRGCVWINGVAHDLGTVAGGNTAKSSAADINDHGQIVGISDVAGGQPHACLFQIDASGQVTQRTDLGLLGGQDSAACGINNLGVVVGISNGRAFVWRAGAMTDLNSAVPPGSGWFISRATAINDAGMIVGEGVRFGFGHAVLLTPVTCVKGDMNGDGQVDGLDVQSFVDVLLGGGTPNQVCAGDVDPAQDGLVTPTDVTPFVQCLLAGGCI